MHGFAARAILLLLALPTLLPLSSDQHWITPLRGTEGSTQPSICVEGCYLLLIIMMPPLVLLVFEQEQRNVERLLPDKYGVCWCLLECTLPTVGSGSWRSCCSSLSWQHCESIDQVRGPKCSACRPPISNLSKVVCRLQHESKGSWPDGGSAWSSFQRLQSAVSRHHVAGSLRDLLQLHFISLGCPQGGLSVAGPQSAIRTFFVTWTGIYPWTCGY